MGSIATYVLFSYRIHSAGLQFNPCYEQSLTKILLIFSVFGTNPLYICFAFFASSILNFFDIIVTHAFEGFLPFSLLAILRRIQFRKLENGLLKLNLFFGISFFSIGFFSNLYHVDSLSYGIPIHDKQIISLLKIGYWVLVAIYAIYVMLLFFFQKTDLTEANVSAAYTALTMIYLLSQIARLYISSNPKYNQASAYFALTISSGHGLVLILTFFHWPYESTIDQKYIGPAENEPDVIDDNVLMVDEDSDKNVNSENS